MDNNPKRIGKNYSEIRQENKDLLFLLRENNAVVCRIRAVFNSIGGSTYMGITFTFWDENWNWIAQNMEWLRETDLASLRADLAKQNFRIEEPTEFETILYDSSPLLLK